MPRVFLVTKENRVFVYMSEWHLTAEEEEEEKEEEKEKGARDNYVSHPS